MITQISYNVLIERFRAFAAGHYLIKQFTHGHPSVIDIEKGLEFPWMHVFPVEVEPRPGSRLYSFVVTFADLPRDKETPTEYEREIISDCIKLAEDLVAEIQNGLVLFGPTVELEGSPSIEVFIQEYSQTLTGVNLAITLSVPWDWSACDIPADWTVGGSGSGGSGGGVGLVLKTNGVNNAVQSLLNLQQGTNITLVDQGNGTVLISASGGGGGGGVSSVGLSMPSGFSVANSPITSSGTLAVTANGTSSDYLDGTGAVQPFPTIPTELNDLTDVNVQSPVDGETLIYFSGGNEFKNQPLATVATSGDYNDLSNLPTIPAAQVNSDWNAVGGVAEILNKPTIPVNLDDLGDVNAPSPTNGQVLAFNSTSGDWEAITPASGGSVTSVGLTMPSAFTVSGSPVTTAGTLAVSGAGTTDQYIRGDGTLANFPSTGGGGGQIFYFNGNVAQPSIGGNNYFQLGTNANTGPAADFTRATTGVIARFITDVGSPNHLIIPSGVWTIDVYLSETGGGANHAEILAKLYTYNGSTFTLVATSPVEEITNGSVPDLYTFTISVPSTVTAATDRIHIEFDIQNTNGKTVTLYTEDGKIGEVHSTYAIGLSSLNGLTANTQTFATGTTGTDFGINSVGSVHTFNLPTASASNRGALSSSDWSTFNGKLTGNAAITGATKTKITYDSKGLVTAGADLSASDMPTGIDAANIGTGAVSNTEFGYLDGVTSAIQTQLNNKKDSLAYGNVYAVTAGASSTVYAAISGLTTFNATESNRHFAVPVAGVIKNFYVKMSGTQSATGTLVITVRNNATSSAVTVTVSSADGASPTKSDNTNTLTVAAGDLLAIQLVNNATVASASIVSMSFIIERT